MSGMLIGAVQKFLGQVGPWFLHNKNLGSFLDATAITLDETLQTLDIGLRLSQPLRCDASALPVLGYDRTIPFYPNETEESKRFRLSQWLQLHRQRGTHIGELRHSQPYFLPDAPMMRIVHQSGGALPVATWHTLSAAGEYSIYRPAASNWNWDGQTSKWSRFWVIAYAPARLCSLIRYGDGSHYGDGIPYAGASSHQVAQDLVDMIRGWKGAHSALWGYCIATDPASFDPTASATTSPDGWTSLPVGNWGQPVTSGGARTRIPSALWIYDRRDN